MARIVLKGPISDFRNLPSTYDPHMFYEYAISRAMLESEGIEWFLYRLIPHGLIRSFAIAIDPFSNFRGNLYGKVTKVNRNRSRLSGSILDTIYEYRVTTEEHRGTIPNWNNIPGRNSPFTVYSTTTAFEKFGPLATTTPSYLCSSADTTRRTRPIGSDMGEFVSQQVSCYSSPRSNHYSDRNDVRVHVNATPDNDQVSTGGKTYSVNIAPSASYIRTGDLDAIRSGEKAFSEKLIRENVVGMMSKVSPFHRDYTLFRNVVELRDLPRSIASLQKTAVDLVSLQRSLNFGTFRDVIHSLNSNVKNIPNEYLSYMFGWRQLYRDSLDLLSFPDRLVKKINFLIRKSGRATTLRYSKRIRPSVIFDVPGFRYPLMAGDNGPFVITSTITRSAELRIVCNATFDFPDVMSPNFRKTHYLRQLGVSPTATDIYNLIPWTWLFDWFTGLGDYIDAIETINSDPKLVNWAVITCDLTSELQTNFSWRTRSTSNVNWSGDLNVHTSDDIWMSNTHMSAMIMKTKVRKDVLTAMSGVRTTSDTSSLTSYQNSILGALLAQRVKSPHR